MSQSMGSRLLSRDPKEKRKDRNVVIVSGSTESIDEKTAERLDPQNYVVRVALTGCYALPSRYDTRDDGNDSDEDEQEYCSTTSSSAEDRLRDEGDVVVQQAETMADFDNKRRTQYFECAAAEVMTAAASIETHGPTSKKTNSNPPPLLILKFDFSELAAQQLDEAGAVYVNREQHYEIETSFLYKEQIFARELYSSHINTPHHIDSSLNERRSDSGPLHLTTFVFPNKRGDLSFILYASHQRPILRPLQSIAIVPSDQLESILNQTQKLAERHRRR